MKPYIAHYVAELEGVNAKLLNNPQRFLKIMLRVSTNLHLTLVGKPHIHQFKPFGLSLVFILAESHLAAHTWPENNFMNIDIQVCSPKVTLGQLGPLLQKEFKPTKMFCEPVNRLPSL